MHNTSSSPDDHSQGFLLGELNALRYDGHTEDAREVAGILRSFMPSGVRVLDVGCGTGSVTTIANREKHNNVYGIEPDPARAKVARSRGIEVFEGYLTDGYLVGREKFDVIMFADVLEHIAEPSTLLRIAAKGLKDDGLLLVSVPNVAHWSVRYDLMRGRFEYTEVGIKDATHLRWFTSTTITNLLQREGFEVLECKQSAGVDLPDYHNRLPWKWIPGRIRRLIIHALTFALPLLFGCQHVLRARIRK